MVGDVFDVLVEFVGVDVEDVVWVGVVGVVFFEFDGFFDVFDDFVLEFGCLNVGVFGVDCFD